MTTNIDPYTPSPWSRLDPAPEIPKQRTPWFVLLMMVFAVIVAVLMVVGFWMAANPQFG